MISHPSPNQTLTEAHSLGKQDRMASLQIKTEYQPVCSCRNTYSEPFDNESEAMLSIREFPLCSNCENAE